MYYDLLAFKCDLIVSFAKKYLSRIKYTFLLGSNNVIGDENGFSLKVQLETCQGELASR